MDHLKTYVAGLRNIWRSSTDDYSSRLCTDIDTSTHGHHSPEYAAVVQTFGPLLQIAQLLAELSFDSIQTCCDRTPSYPYLAFHLPTIHVLRGDRDQGTTSVVSLRILASHILEPSLLTCFGLSPKRYVACYFRYRDCGVYVNQHSQIEEERSLLCTWCT